ncbi:alpha-soluble NSF attachment protein 2 [Histomonas meleagridis]|uniref:alpha-soluble NSF attachment protein 2 n=1 Tax=Histomonas meleagridis TaxID=135588 RepID=UPI003559AA0A|nr:alpha-soluble NSF attachment protein 2 [Histomonas meleagridis]KAH0805822.1 alpha-soluble NSF attachment protein 2 [Histomonas meleagridis]
MSNRGDDFYANAEKALKKFRVFDKSGKYSEAGDLFMKAGNAYKSVRNFERAGDAYTRAADCFQALNSLNEAASAAAESGKMFAKNPETTSKAIEAFRFASQIYRENSKATNAARLLVDAAKLFQDNGDLDSAIDTLTDAAQLYDDENQPIQAATQLAMIADLQSMKKDWLKAANSYKDVAERRMGDRLTQLAAGEYFTKAIACQMAGDDAVGAEKMLRDFVNLNPGWERTRECAMLQATLKAIDERDVEAFQNALAEYDQFKKLDNWMVTTFTEVKKLLEGEDDIC